MLLSTASSTAVMALVLLGSSGVPGDGPQVELVTIGPGEGTHEPWGASALRVYDPKDSASDRAYEMGDDWISRRPFSDLLAEFAKQDRTITRRALHISLDEASALAVRLSTASVDRRAVPPSSCPSIPHRGDGAQRIAWEIDRATGGALAHADYPGSRSLRLRILDPLRGSTLAYVALDLMMSGAVDHPLGAFEGCFFPEGLAALAGRASASDGASLEDPRPWFPAGCLMDSGAPPSWRPRLLPFDSPLPASWGSGHLRPGGPAPGGRVSLVDREYDAYRSTKADTGVVWTWPWTKIYILFVSPFVLLAFVRTRLAMLMYGAISEVIGIGLVAIWLDPGRVWFHGNWNIAVFSPLLFVSLWDRGRAFARGYLAFRLVVLVGLWTATAMGVIHQAIGPAIGALLPMTLALFAAQSRSDNRTTGRATGLDRGLP